MLMLLHLILISVIEIHQFKQIVFEQTKPNSNKERFSFSEISKNTVFM